MARRLGTPGFRFRPGAYQPPVEPEPGDRLNYMMASATEYFSPGDFEAFVWRLPHDVPLPDVPRLPDLYFAVDAGDLSQYLSPGPDMVFVAGGVKLPPVDISALPAGAFIMDPSVPSYLLAGPGEVLVWSL